ncbi:MAG: NAD-dependent epimerase/dehydratase family protein [Chloroflexi bacterium]|nr:MAG: NAD-dependent epimerase/dehydratase family protein [Chloroflexota bacterium]
MTPASLANARVLVTGATGLVGSSLVRCLLSADAEVHALVLPEPEPESDLLRSGRLARIRVHEGRLEDPVAVAAAVEAARPRFVFHLGAQPLVGLARAHPVATFEANVRGTWALLEACRTMSEPPIVAVASSDKAYGASAKLPYVETDPLAGSEPYEASKAITDILAQTYARSYGLPTRIARCGNIYGIGDWNWSRIVPGTIRSLLRGERPVLRSDGTPVRDYIHVDDVVAAYLALATADVAPGEAFNFSSGERLTVREVVDAVTAAVGAALQPVVLNEARGEIAAQYLDSSKARTTLGWKPRRRLGESLSDIVTWYRELLG